MNISEHATFFEQEMKRRNFSIQTINNYSSCIKVFFSKSDKDHPKNIQFNVCEKKLRTYL